MMEARREQQRLRLRKWIIRALLLLAFGILVYGGWQEAAHGEPQAARKYRATVIRTTRAVWGINGPSATEGAQIQQESGWNPAAHSAVADGLAEFTPATAQWISGAYHLGPAEPYSPAWAIRALVTYDENLWANVAAIPPPATTPCDHMAFTLSAYNGGIKWIARDRTTAKQFRVANLGEWFGAVEYFSKRSTAAFKENRGYPQRILLVLQPNYLSWGGAVDCSVIKGRPTWARLSHS